MPEHPVLDDSVLENLPKNGGIRTPRNPVPEKDQIIIDAYNDVLKKFRDTSLLKIDPPPYLIIHEGRASSFFHYYDWDEPDNDYHVIIIPAILTKYLQGDPFRAAIAHELAHWQNIPLEVQIAEHMDSNPTFLKTHKQDLKKLKLKIEIAADNIAAKLYSPQAMREALVTGIALSDIRATGKEEPQLRIVAAIKDQVARGLMRISTATTEGEVRMPPKTKGSAETLRLRNLDNQINSRSR